MHSRAAASGGEDSADDEWGVPHTAAETVGGEEEQDELQEWVGLPKKKSPPEQLTSGKKPTGV